MGAYKGAKLAYNTFKYGTKLKFTNITTKKSKPNFQANISLRQLHNRLGKAGWNQETFYKNGLQIRDFTKNGRKITTRDGSVMVLILLIIIQEGRRKRIMLLSLG